MMLSCWRLRPQSRPNFTHLENQLDKLVTNPNKKEYFKLYAVLQDTSSENVKHYSNIYPTRWEDNEKCNNMFISSVTLLIKFLHASWY